MGTFWLLLFVVLIVLLVVIVAMGVVAIRRLRRGPLEDNGHSGSSLSEPPRDDPHPQGPEPSSAAEEKQSQMLAALEQRSGV
ncbi:MAG: ribonuclease Y, partial [Propionibacterium sp.]|nr:ribonuclease Y [Propionibacterium sp.]